MRLNPQIAAVAAGLAFWALWPRAELWWLVAAYALGWLLVNALWRRAWRRELRVGRAAAVLGLLLLAAPVAHLGRRGEAVVREERFTGFATLLGDRLRLEEQPTLAPGRVHLDRPQVLYLYAPGAEEARLRLGPEVDLASTALGHGLFRVWYDPQEDGLPETGSARLEASLIVDGRKFRRRLEVVAPEAHPRWFAAKVDLGLAATVSEETDEVLVFSRRGLEGRFRVGNGPTDVADGGAGGRWAVGHRYGRDVWLLSGDGEVEERVFLGGPVVRLATSLDRRRLAAATGGSDPGVHLLDLTGEEERRFLPTDFQPDWVSFVAGGELVLSGRRTRALHRVRLEGREATWREPLLLGRPAVTLRPSADGRFLYLPTTDFRPGGVEHRGNHFVQDQILTVDVGGWRVERRLLTARRSPRQGRAGSVDRGVSPMGIAVRGDGSLLVAFAGSDEVWLLEPDGAGPREIVAGRRLDLVAPHGVADLGGGYWVASSPAGGAVAVFGPQGEMVSFVGLAPTDKELAAAPPDSLARRSLRLRAGERAFYETTRTGISCQSCHLHADTDHSRHDIGQRSLLHTLTVRGVGGTSPYLRDGSFPRIRDLDAHLARTLYRGYRRALPARGELLEEYVELLPGPLNFRHYEEGDPARQRAGLQALVKARCDLCHSLPAFTNLGHHPVRSLFPEYGAGQLPLSRLDTPSLLGVQTRSHLLQDGRAEGLYEVLTAHNEANLHGDSAALDDGEKAALVYFLERL